MSKPRWLVMTVAFAVLAVFMAISPLLAEEPDAMITVACDEVKCTVSKKLLVDLVEAHNLQVTEIRKYEAMDCKPKLKTERNS